MELLIHIYIFYRNLFEFSILCVKLLFYNRCSALPYSMGKASTLSTTVEKYYGVWVFISALIYVNLFLKKWPQKFACNSTHCYTTYRNHADPLMGAMQREDYQVQNDVCMRVLVSPSDLFPAEGLALEET